MNVVHEIFKDDNLRKIEIIERKEGTFYFEELMYGEQEQAWYPCGSYCTNFFDTKETALFEAKERISWLKEQKGN